MEAGQDCVGQWLFVSMCVCVCARARAHAHAGGGAVPRQGVLVR